MVFTGSSANARETKRAESRAQLRWLIVNLTMRPMKFVVAMETASAACAIARSVQIRKNFSTGNTASVIISLANEAEDW